MKELYTLENILTDEAIVIFLHDEKEWEVLNKLIEINFPNHGQVTTDYYGPYCYSPSKKTFSSSSTKTDPTDYQNATIITIDQIDIRDSNCIYELIRNEYLHPASIIAKTNECEETIRELIPVYRAIDECVEKGIDIWFYGTMENPEIMGTPQMDKIVVYVDLSESYKDITDRLLNGIREYNLKKDVERKKHFHGYYLKKLKSKKERNDTV